MPKVPPPAVISAADKARTGLDVLKRNLVPPHIAALDFVNNFWAFHIAFTLAELSVPDALSARPRASADIARELGVDADMLYRVLRAGSQLGLVHELTDRVFELKPVGRALCSDDPNSFRDFVVYMGRHGTRWWRRMPDCVKTGKTAIELETGKTAFEAFAAEPHIGADFDRAMTATNNVAAEALVAAYDFSTANTIVDVGGGHGALLATILATAPKPRGILFDQAQVVAGAEPLLTARGVRSRVEIAPGDFFAEVPSGGDCYVLKAVIHDWSDEDSRKILSNVRRAMTPGARVLLFEAIVGPRNAASFAKLLDIEMLVNAHGGRERTHDEYAALLASAGLKLERILPTASPFSIVEAFAA
jgi:SAM-dependent methyltransferase